MRRALLLLCCLALPHAEAHIAGDELYQALVERIVLELNPYQVVVFARGRDDLLCHVLLHRLPAIIVDLGRIAVTGDARSLKSPVLKYPTPTSLHIVSERQDDRHLDRLRDTLDALVEASPNLPRAKVLVILHGESSSCEDHLDGVLEYAWSLQFLDFTVIVVTPSQPPRLLNYNAFTRRLYRRTLASWMRLFPYKLHDMQGYPLRVPAIDLPPYLYTVRDPITGRPVGVQGMSSKYLEIFAAAMNFSVEVVPGAEDSVIRADFAAVFRKLHTGEIDMLTFPFNVRSIMYNFRDWLLMGRLFLSTNYVLVVPIVPLLRVDVPLDIIVCIPLLFVIILVYAGVARLLRFPRRHWEAEKIFQILLGVTVMRRPPRRLVEQFVYFSLIVLSMKYSMDMLTKIMDIKLLKGEVGFDSLEEIAASELPIYTLDFVIEHVFSNAEEDELVARLHGKTLAVQNIYECVNQIVENKSCMCITPHSAGNMSLIYPILQKKLLNVLQKS